MKFKKHIISISLILILKAVSAKADDLNIACGGSSAIEKELLKLQTENAELSLKLNSVSLIKESIRSAIKIKKIERLQKTLLIIEEQRKSIHDFEAFVKWMSANVAGYNRYIQAGSYVAAIGKMLPIPYAGQASLFAKFIAQFTTSLNNTSVATAEYLKSSDKFITKVNQISKSSSVTEKDIDDTVNYGDRELLKSFSNAKKELTSVAELSSGAMSFFQTLNHYAMNSDEYINKLKSVFKKNVDMKEKSFISETSLNLKKQVEIYNNNLHSFNQLGEKLTTSIKGFEVYDELEKDALNLLNVR